MASPNCGEFWFADLDPVIGHEQARERPVLILFVTSFNQSPAARVVLLPMTTKIRGIPWHVPVSPPEDGLTRPSVILCEQPRAVSQQRLQPRMGLASAATVAAVQDRLRILMNL